MKDIINRRYDGNRCLPGQGGRVGPAPLHATARWSADLAYRRVRASGTFLHVRKTLVQAVTDRGARWWVLFPLRTDPGLLVGQPRLRAARTAIRRRGRRAGQPAGRVTVTGLLRASELGGAFLRRNDHLVYALTWFTLAGLSALGVWLALRRRRA